MKPGDLKPISGALAALGQAAGKAGLIVAAGSIYTASRAAYIESGAVYGDTQKGFLRWLGEVSEAIKRDREKSKSLRFS